MYRDRRGAGRGSLKVEGLIYAKEAKCVVLGGETPAHAYMPLC